MNLYEIVVKCNKNRTKVTVEYQENNTVYTRDGVQYVLVNYNSVPLSELGNVMNILVSDIELIVRAYIENKDDISSKIDELIAYLKSQDRGIYTSALNSPFEYIEL